jgi:Rrf2 family protein
VILNQLKHAGYVESVRGKHGGYVLALKPRDITVGEIIKAVQGPIKKPADQRKETPVRGDYAFKTMWENVRKAVSEMCDSVSFTELIEMERGGRTSFMLNYAI